nr:type IV secretory system conjugative DNA transfer family protein [Escherichia coli]
MSQLNEIYGVEGAKTLMSAHPRIIYAVSEEDDAKRFRKSWAISPLNRQDQARQADAQRRKVVQKVRRSAPFPQELGTLDFKEEFIILKGENPLKLRKPSTSSTRILWTGDDGKP